jgi:heme exporter protein D
MDLGPHAAFIWASYGIVALVLAMLIGWLGMDGRQQQRRLDELDARGVRRRSASGAAPSRDEVGQEDA